MVQLPVKLGRFPQGRGLSKAVKKNVRKLLESVMQVQQGKIVGAFNVGGHHRHGGKKWVALSPSTRRQKARAGKGTLMVVTGRLRNSIRTVLGSEGGRARGRIIADAPYAVHHQFGAPRAGLPQRKVVVITKQDQRAMRNLMQKGLQRLIDGGRS